MIRDFKPSDMQQVLDIWLEASAKAHDFVGREFWESRVEDMRNVYLPGAETFVFEENGSVKGFVSLCGNTLAAIFVAPESQGKGIGWRLLDKAKAVRSSLSLTVYEENTDSVRFYENAGFRVSERQTDEHTGQPELLMEFDS